MTGESLKKLGTDTLYSEGCNTFRHYSTASMNIRTISIAQAFVIISAIIFFGKDGYYLESVGASIFGLGFTIVLYRLHRGYFNNAMDIADYLVGFEKSYSPDEVGSNKIFISKREERMASFCNESAVINGPHIFLFIAFITSIIYCGYKLIF